jgi:hypothetical protein
MFLDRNRCAQSVAKVLKATKHSRRASREQDISKQVAASAMPFLERCRRQAVATGYAALRVRRPISRMTSRR